MMTTLLRRLLDGPQPPAMVPVEEDAHEEWCRGRHCSHCQIATQIARPGHREARHARPEDGRVSRYISDHEPMDR